MRIKGVISQARAQARAWAARVGCMVEAVLHIGAHRCATTTFQGYLDQNRQVLAGQGVAVWTPQDTRAGLFDGFIRAPENNAPDQVARQTQAANRMHAAMDAMDHDGMQVLLVSEENMIGTPRDNLQRAAFYPGAVPRLTRFCDVFAGRVTRIGLAIRSYDTFWSSLLSFAVSKGADVPKAEDISKMGHDPYCWSMLAQDIRRLFPDATLNVWPFETFAGRPRRQFNMLSARPQITHMLDHTPAWRNHARSTRDLRRILRAQGRFDAARLLPKGDGMWMPYDDLTRAAMAARYADDLALLRSGTDPMITFTEKAAIKVPRKMTGDGDVPLTGGHQWTRPNAGLS